MKSRLLIAVMFPCFLLLIVTLSFNNTLAQQPTATPSVGTLVPPTLVPVTTSTETPLSAVLVNESGIVTLQQNGVLRVGALFNVPPFVWLDEKGTVTGYEADIARAIAEELGVEIEFTQVTTETQIRMLLSSEVDMLIGQQIHARHLEEFVEFSHTYYYNEQRMVIREADIALYPNLREMANRPIGVVAGSRSEEAINIWMARNGIGLQLTRYLSLDAALDALSAGEVAGIVGELDDLRRAGRLQMSLVPEAVQQDPYAIALRRHDVNLRNLVNRTLQRLMAQGTIPELGRQWFPDEEINYAAFIPQYQNLNDDSRTLDDFSPDMPVPARSVVDNILTGQQLVVAGLDMTDGGFYWHSFLDAINRDIVNEMARRWGTTVVFLPDTATTGTDMVAGRQADLAMGVRAIWDSAERVDYSVPYHYSGDRLLILDTTSNRSRFRSMNDFRGGFWIGYFQDDPGDKEYLESLGGTFSVYGFPDSTIAIEKLFETRDVDAMFGDTVRLLAFAERYSPPDWFLLPPLYGPNPFQPIVIALPRNDADFRSLVNWTLGEMFADGTLDRLWEANYPTDEWLEYGIDVSHWIPNWPGIGDFLFERD